MKTRRPLSVNNSLVHGICNYHCRLCGIKKAGYDGPREFQPYVVTKTLIQRIQESAQSGNYVRYVANSGDGESTLHPEFSDRMRMFGRMLKGWDSDIPPPEVSVVTNGSRLTRPGILESFVENDLTMIISLPTLKPESYGLIMAGNGEKGGDLLANVLPGVNRAMSQKASGALSNLYFHISPPETKIIRNDFPKTIDGLTRLAANNGLDELQLVLFPAPSNRSGLVSNSAAGVDMYRDLFKQYNGSIINSVTIRMQLVLHRFFSSISEIGDLLRSFRFPCLWNANFFISSDGSSICCNDQSVRTVQGNIIHDSIETLIQVKEQFRPGPACEDCNQSPQNLHGSFEAKLFSLLAKARMGFCQHYHRNPVSKVSSLKTTEILPPRKEPEHSISYENKKEFLSGPKLAENLNEMEEAFHLIYNKYVAAGLQKYDPSMMRINFHNLLPTSYLLINRKKGKINGTLTLIRECHGILPLNELFADEIDQIRKKDSMICELSGLAVEAESYRKSKRILLSLFQSTFILAYDLLGCTDFCMMVNPAHSAYYEKELEFDRMGEVKQYGKVNGAPAVFLRLDLTTSEELLQRKRPLLHHYLLKDRRKIKERLLGELRHQKKLFTSKLINKLQKDKMDLMENLTADERELLYRYYPGLQEKYNPGQKKH